MCMIQDLPSFVMYCGLHSNILLESESTVNLDARYSASSLEMSLVLTLAMALVLCFGVLSLIGWKRMKRAVIVVLISYSFAIIRTVTLAGRILC